MCLWGFSSCWVRLSRVWVRGKAGKEKCAHSPQACTDKAGNYLCVLWASLRAPVLYCVMSAVWESQAFRCLCRRGQGSGHHVGEEGGGDLDQRALRPRALQAVQGGALPPLLSCSSLGLLPVWRLWGGVLLSKMFAGCCACS